MCVSAALPVKPAVATAARSFSCTPLPLYQVFLKIGTERECQQNSSTSTLHDLQGEQVLPADAGGPAWSKPQTRDIG